MKTAFGGKVISVLVALAMVCSLMVTAAFATSGVWSGSGTQDDPYQIVDQADLAAINSGLSSSNTYSNVYFRVMNDISLDSTWAGIGSPTISNYSTNSPYVSGGTGFAGTLYGLADSSGECPTITVNRSVSASGRGGLVNFLAPGGRVLKLNVIGSVSAAGSVDAVGGVVGYNCGIIDSVTACVSVTADSAYNVGGIAGFNDGYYVAHAQGTIRNCAHSSATVNGTACGAVSGKSKVGGIAGENAGTIASCSNTAAVTDPNYGKNGVGGIAVRNGDNNTATETGIIRDCYNTADISCTNGKWVGGICGFENSLSSCTNCYDTGNMYAISYKDPISGKTEGTNTNCYYKSGISGVEGYDGATSEEDDYMKTHAFRDLLNGSPSLGRWTQTAGSYPVLTGGDMTVNASAVGVTGTTPTLETDGIILGGSSADYTDLTSAIAAAISQDKTIYVAGTVALSGTYNGLYADNTTKVLIKRSVTFGDILFTVSSGATAELSNMTIDGNGGNVTGSNLIRTYGGSLTMDATVTLQNSTINSNGGAIHVQGGTVESAATIRNCSARYGGGVYLSGGSFTLTGGSVSGCSAQEKGAGVYVSTGTTFALNASSLTVGNTVYLESDTYITVQQAIPCDLEVECAVTAGGTVIAQGTSSYSVSSDDVDCITMISGAALELNENNNQIVFVS